MQPRLDTATKLQRCAGSFHCRGFLHTQLCQHAAIRSHTACKLSPDKMLANGRGIHCPAQGHASGPHRVAGTLHYAAPLNATQAAAAPLRLAPVVAPQRGWSGRGGAPSSVAEASTSAPAAAGWDYKYQRRPCSSPCHPSDGRCLRLEALFQNVLDYPRLPPRVYR